MSQKGISLEAQKYKSLYEALVKKYQTLSEAYDRQKRIHYKQELLYATLERNYETLARFKVEDLLQKVAESTLLGLIEQNYAVHNSIDRKEAIGEEHRSEVP